MDPIGAGCLVDAVCVCVCVWHAGVPAGAAAASDLALVQDEEEEALLGNMGVLLPDPAAAAEAFNAAAEEASAAFKGKLAQRYFERAAEAEVVVEEGGSDAGDG